MSSDDIQRAKLILFSCDCICYNYFIDFASNLVVQENRSVINWLNAITSMNAVNTSLHIATDVMYGFKEYFFQTSGTADGFIDGLADGFVDGLADGFADAFANDGFIVGLRMGLAVAFADGLADGLADIFNGSFDVGANEGGGTFTASEFGWPHLPVTNFEMPFLRPQQSLT